MRLAEKQSEMLPKIMISIAHTEDQSELAQWYSAVTVFFDPAYEDSFFIKNLEDLACGTPVVTYRTGDSSEAIDEKTGFIVATDELTTALDYIRKDRECRKI